MAALPPAWEIELPEHSPSRRRAKMFWPAGLGMVCIFKKVQIYLSQHLGLASFPGKPRSYKYEVAGDPGGVLNGFIIGQQGRD